MDKKKGPEKPISPEIVTLTEKLSKDPKSRVFMPLAEEYLKSGMIEEAKMVLTDGLKIHPNLHTARAILGKVFIEMGLVAEARAEFERVIKADPENLLAHRKLAKLYKETGQLDQARTSCKAVLLSNPKDAEMKLILDDLDRIEASQLQKAQEQSALSTESAPVEMAVEHTAHAQSVSESEPVPAVTSEPPAETAPPSETVSSAPVEAPPPKVEAASVGDTGSGNEPAPVEVKEPVPSLEEIMAGTTTDTPETETAPERAGAGTMSSEGTFAEQSPAASPPTEEITTEALADLYVKQGFYEKGIAIYRRLLANDPTNQALFKKLDETVDLARLLNEGPQLKTASKPVTEAPPSPSPSKEVSDDKAPPPQGPSAGDRDQQRMQKIQRLQSWLDSIKKGQNG